MPDQQRTSDIKCLGLLSQGNLNLTETNERPGPVGLTVQALNSCRPTRPITTSDISDLQELLTQQAWENIRKRISNLCQKVAKRV